MNICVTAKGDNWDALVDPLFGRCQYFIFVDTEEMSLEAVLNPNQSGSGGVGVRSGQFVVEKNIKAVLTGNVGPNAARTLQAAGVDIILGVDGNVKDAVEKYKKGEFSVAQGPNVGEKAGFDNHNGGAS